MYDENQDTAPAQPQYSGDYTEIKPPSSFKPPEPMEGKDTFEIVDTWKVKPDGRICLVKLGETPMPQKDEAPSHDGLAREIVSATNQ